MRTLCIFWLIVKQEHLPLATELFADSGVQITVEGRRHLGAALGTESFTESYVKGKVQEWVEEVTRLSEIATSQPHAAYAARTHGLLSKWTYLLRTVPDVSNLLIQLRGQCAFFDVRVFNPLAPSNCRSSLNTTYRHHESLKKRNYEQRVREVEHGSFTTLVFSATGGMAPAATIAFKRLTSLLA